MAYETITVEQRDAVTLITLNRPKALNALNSTILAELTEAFAAYEADKSQLCAVLTGSGDKAFAAAPGDTVVIGRRALAHAVIGNGQDEFLGGAKFGNAFSAQGSLVDGFFAIIVRDFLFLARRSAAHRGGMLQIAARFFRRNVHMTQDAH